MVEYAYEGTELELFAHAIRWKRYLHCQIVDYVGSDVLEVGAGIGSNTQLMAGSAARSWTCLEPDPAMARRIDAKIAAGELPTTCQLVVGTLATLPPERTFDTILYCDVLEHIADDAGEVWQAALRLNLGGHLIVLSPAHPWLFTRFDKAIGHHRRYTRRTLVALTAPTLRLERLRYLDSAGLLASMANRVLSPVQPTTGQIWTWDRLMVPVSRLTDRLFRHRIGKSVLVVWQKVSDR
jgi:SAM-dependent methyltransferase